jgi:hypothetical protein
MKRLAMAIVTLGLATISSAAFAQHDDGKSTTGSAPCTITLDNFTHYRYVSSIPECQSEFNEIYVQHCSEVGVGWYGWAFIDYVGPASAWEFVHCQ